MLRQLFSPWIGHSGVARTSCALSSASCGAALNASDRMSDPVHRLCALRPSKNCDPFPASPQFHDNNPVSLQRADQLSLLVAQNTRKNQPLSAFQFWQNLNQQFAEQICSDDFNSWRKRPPPDVGDAKIDVIELVSSGVFSRGRDGHRIVIYRDDSGSAKPFRCQRKNSSAGAKIKQRSFRFWGTQAATLLGSAASRTLFSESSTAS
jgi:hypothetical protein